MKIKFYFIILFCIYIQKSYNMDFINNLDFSTGSKYTIVLFSAIGYIYKDYQISNQIKNEVEEVTRTKLENKPSILPWFTLFGGTCAGCSLVWFEEIFSKN